MTDTTPDDYFTPNHKKLLRFSSVANVFVWIVIVITLLLTITQFIGNLNVYRAATGQAGGYFALWWQNTLAAFQVTLSLLKTLVQGLALALVLRGVALALDMIVETDLNYRDAADSEDSDE